MVKIWETGKNHIEWEEGSVCPIFKKGDQLECRNYRGITVLNTAYKIFSNLLFAKLQPYTDKVIGNYQCGFIYIYRPQRSIIDQIHTLRQILEKTKEYNIKTFHLFVDFKAAYDSINREKMIEAMTEFKIPKNLSISRKLLLKMYAAVLKYKKYLSEPFTIERVLRQGDSLACLLFNLVLEKCIRDSGLDRSGTLWNKSLQLLAYADDIDIIGRSEKAVKEAFQALEISATNMGLTINEDKTKFMETLPCSVNNTSFCVNGHSFERVSEFKYLGNIINDQNKLKAEINNRIKFWLTNVFFWTKEAIKIEKFFSGKTKLRLYTTLILPVLLYASETWTLNLETIRALETFERKTLITIFGPVKDQGCWRTTVGRKK
ncbi:reverse transcriptase domain-containing protein [Trichonephila clavipes]|uniref:Reverse transcriptase domain-containing protein n=1 Tax=Trichonephila clavipes TaxID=2585209 RepID=A0A8X6RLN1_TRICX|nr:reverse transcriptase domain-containing protein [Trichonephila clavipes]